MKTPSNVKKPDNIVVEKSNSKLIALVGVYISYWKSVNGGTDEYIALGVGCTQQSIQSIRTMRPFRCSLSFLSRVSLFFGLELMELLDEAREIKEWGSIGAAGSVGDGDLRI